MSNSQDEKKPVESLNPEFYDPVKLAEFVAALLEPYAKDRTTLPMPSQAEIEQWSLSESELDKCANEFLLFMAMGDTVTVMKNKPFEFYSAYLHALAPRLCKLMYGHQSITSSDELIGVIEKYIEKLEKEEIVDFASTYTERVFDGNPNEGEIFAAKLWTRAFDMMMTNMDLTRKCFIQCIEREETYNILGNEIAGLRDRYVELEKQMQHHGAAVPVESCKSMLREVDTLWVEAKKDDSEVKIVALIGIWWGVNNFLQSTKQGDELVKFVEDRNLRYKCNIISDASVGARIPTDRLLASTEREIKAGRMTEDHHLRQLALNAKAALCFDVFEYANRRENSELSESFMKVIDLALRLKKVRSFIRFFGI